MRNYPHSASGLQPCAGGKGAKKMSIAAVLRVFKYSSLITPQGEFNISRVFPNRKSAKKAQYHFFSSDNGVIIYRRRTKTGRMKYAYIGD
jgi:hypothetical protein